MQISGRITLIGKSRTAVIMQKRIAAPGIGPLTGARRFATLAPCNPLRTLKIPG
jgi:hypothetical protein